MLGLELILIVCLQFEGTTGGVLYLYNRSGNDVVLPCNSPSLSYSCSNVNWLYYRDTKTSSLHEVEKGKVVPSSRRAARLNVDSKCSLIINNITEEDAGGYMCDFGSGSPFEDFVLLSVLTIFPSLPAADPAKDENVTLLCFLKKYTGLDHCPGNILRWLDETGTELTGKGDGYELKKPWSCVSSLTVLHQSFTNRRYTCQFVEGNNTKVEAHYTAEFKATGSTDWSPLSFIMLTLRITGLILMVGITAGIIRTTGSKKPQKDMNVHDAVYIISVDYENNRERSAAATLR